MRPIVTTEMTSIIAQQTQASERSKEQTVSFQIVVVAKSWEVCEVKRPSSGFDGYSLSYVCGGGNGLIIYDVNTYFALSLT